VLIIAFWLGLGLLSVLMVWGLGAVTGADFDLVSLLGAFTLVIAALAMGLVTVFRRDG
jgi:uncharacterized membrane protein